MQNDLTEGSVLKALIQFSLPYLLSCFLQTFYGMADVLIVGQFNGAAAITAVSVGSQIMHMITVIIVGLAMGSTVMISRAVGEKNVRRAGQNIGNTITLFLAVALVLTAGLLLFTDEILRLLAVPQEALGQTGNYLLICFAGIPVITAYNIISCIFRGIGDSRSPLYFVAAACVLNIALDFGLVGAFDMGASGAALATVISQTASVGIALSVICRKRFGVSVKRSDLRPNLTSTGGILKIGLPIALQDGLIQVSFMIITIIANHRGVTAAASVGIVEKIICFVFLVPSAMLSSISSIAAQNVGAGKHRRAFQTLCCGLAIAVTFGAAAAVAGQIFAPQILGLFTGETAVIEMGSQYLKSYIFDCMIAGIHFCFSGYFCAHGYAGISFIQNLAAIVLVRVPGAYFASKLFKDTLYPMGMAAPLGSLLSAVICVAVFLWKRKTFLPDLEKAGS